MKSSRIDVQTLVLAFEQRISELNKNPPNIVPDDIISILLKNAITEEIEKHFVNVIQREIKDALHKEFKKIHLNFVKTTLKNILTDSDFRSSIENRIKKSIIESIV